MKSKVSVNSSGITIPGLLMIAFIVLKLTGVIQWSWWWVLSPAWIPFAIVLLIYSFSFILAIAGEFRKKSMKRKR